MCDLNIYKYGLLTIVLLLGGCSGAAVYETEFDCKSTIPGAVCKPVSEVYDQSLSGTLPNQQRKPQEQDSQVQSKDVTTTSYIAQVQPQQHSDAPIPIRRRPEIMRIFIAPWQDGRDRLMMPQYVFQEVERGKWSLGNKPRSYFAPQVPSSAGY